MVLYKIHDGRMKSAEDVGRSGDERGLMAVASCEVLRGNDTNLFSGLRLHEKDFGMVVGKIGALHRLCDERPKLQCLVRSLMVENKIKGRYVAGLLDEEESAQELLRDGERSLPNLRFADLSQNPL